MTTEIPPPAQPVSYAPAERNEAMRIRRDEVLAALDTPDKLLLDGRSKEDYRGERVGAPLVSSALVAGAGARGQRGHRGHDRGRAFGR